MLTHSNRLQVSRYPTFHRSPKDSLENVSLVVAYIVCYNRDKVRP